MFTLWGKHEELKKLTRIPRSNRNLQTPAFVGVGEDLYLSYYVESYDKNWLGDLSVNPTQAINHVPHVILHFRQLAFYSSTKYQDDTLTLHPMYSKGLRPFGQFEVLNSLKIAQIRESFDASISEQQALPDELRHFIFSIHGHVIEIICHDFAIHKETGAVFSSIENLIQGRSAK